MKGRQDNINNIIYKQSKKQQNHDTEISSKQRGRADVCRERS
jgi:hypothetical protein